MGQILRAIARFEQIACVLAFSVMGLALFADVGKRVIGRLADALSGLPGLSGLGDEASALGFGSGILGAPQVAVIGMIALAMFGFGVAAQHGAQLRPRFLDGVFPKTWGPRVDRAADAVTAGALAVLAGLAGAMVVESARLGDVSSVLRWPIWPMQAIIALAFALNAVRYLIFSLQPALRPQEDAVPETGPAEGAPR